jgi:hypothetical protein
MTSELGSNPSLNEVYNAPFTEDDRSLLNSSIKEAEEISVRLGTANQQPEDLQRTIKTLHDIKNRIQLLSLREEIRAMFVRTKVSY